MRVIGSNFAPTVERDEFLVAEKIKKERKHVFVSFLEIGMEVLNEVIRSLYSCENGTTLPHRSLSHLLLILIPENIIVEIPLIPS